MSDPVHFVLFAAPRTGSNWLCSLLDSHRDVLCHHEIFNPERILTAVSCQADPIHFGSVATRNNDPMAVYEQIWRHPRGARAVGFKLNRGQAPTIAKHVLETQGVRKLLLKRGNRVRTFVSEKIALATGVWESYSWSTSRPENVRIDLDPRELLAHVEENERHFRAITDILDASGQRYLTLEYETLTAAPNLSEALAPTFRFLDVEGDMVLTGATRRQNPQALTELIANYDALERHLREMAPALHAELIEGSAPANIGGDKPNRGYPEWTQS